MSAKKFGRNYILTIESPNFSPLQLGSPFTLEFDIIRNSYSSTNEAKIRLYNLSLFHRNLLLQDQDTSSLGNSLFVTLNAGYGPGPFWPIVFKGNTTRAWSVREGINYVTTLECFDGGIAYTNSKTNRTFSAGQSMGDVFDGLLSDLTSVYNGLPYGVSKGAVSAALSSGTLSRGQSYSGSTIDILRQLSNNNFFVDNLVANVLSQSDAISGNSLTINAASGLLGTPVKEQQILAFDILFEPRIVIGTLVNIDSITSVNSYNGPHKVVSVHHRGTISASVSGDAVTSLTVQAGIFNTINTAVGR
jgi:hypothetical protein